MTDQRPTRRWRLRLEHEAVLDRDPEQPDEAGRYWLPNSPFAPRASATAAAFAAATSFALA